MRSYKVGDHVRHKHTDALGRGTIVGRLDKHPNPDHPKPGPWYRISWEVGPGVCAGRLFHGDTLVPA